MQDACMILLALESHRDYWMPQYQNYISYMALMSLFVAKVLVRSMNMYRKISCLIWMYLFLLCLCLFAPIQMDLLVQYENNATMAEYWIRIIPVQCSENRIS